MIGGEGDAHVRQDTADGSTSYPVSVIRPLAVSTWIGIDASGWFVGPAIASALFAGSKAAPWQGQMRYPELRSYSTVQPACVQTVS